MVAKGRYSLCSACHDFEERNVPNGIRAASEDSCQFGRAP